MSITLFTGKLEIAATAEAPGVSVEHILLRGRFNGTLEAVVGGASVGDVVQARAIELEHARVAWPIGSLLRLNAAPSVVEVDGVALHLRRSAGGALELLSLPPSAPREPRPPALPPDWVLPREERALACAVSNVLIHLPEGPSLAFGLKGSATRSGATLEILESAELHEGEPMLLLHTLRAGLDLGDGAVRVKSTVAVPGARLLEVLAPTLPPFSVHSMDVDMDLRTNLLRPGTIDVEVAAAAKEVLLQLPDQPLLLDKASVKLEAHTQGKQAPTEGSAEVRLSLGPDAVTAALRASLVDGLKRGRVELDASLVSAAWLGTVLLDAGLPEGEFRIASKTTLEIDLEAPSITNLRQRVEATPGWVDLPAGRVALPGWEFDASGGVALAGGEPIGDLHAGFALLGVGEAPASATANLQLGPGAVAADARLDLRLAELVAAFPGLGLPDASGTFSVAFEARGDYAAPSLESAALRIEGEGISVAQPDVLAQRLQVAPFVIKASTRDNAAYGSVDPFAVELGPVRLSSAGIRWTRLHGVIAGGGSVEMSPVELSDVLALLSPELRANMPLDAGSLAELGLRKATVDIQLAGMPQEARIECRTGVDFRLNEGSLAVGIDSRVDLGARAWEVTLDVPDFVAARWNLGLLEQLQVPQLDVPLRARISAGGDFQGALSGVSWQVDAGPGRVMPTGMLAQWLAQPLPIDQFCSGGRLEDACRRLTVERLELKSGRGTLRFSRADVTSTCSLTRMRSADASAFISFTLADWYVEDFLPLLTKDAAALAPVSQGDLASLGLELLSVETEVGLRAGADGMPVLSGAKGHNHAVFRVGGARIPVEVDVASDPAANVLRSSARLESLRLDGLHLEALGPLGEPLAAVHLPFDVELGIEVPFAPGEGASTRATVKVDAGPGEIAPNPFLASRMPVRSLSLELAARLETLSIESFTLAADLDGPRLRIDDVRIAPMTPGEPVGGALHVRLDGFDLAQVRGWVPATRLPPALADALSQAVLEGMLDHFDLRTRFSLDPAAPGPDALEELQLDMSMTGLMLRLPGFPVARVDTIRMGGDLDQMVLGIGGAGVDGAGISQLDLTLERLLAADGEARVHLAAGADLGRVRDIVEEWTARPPTLDPAAFDGLGGTARIEVGASAPLARGSPETLTAAVELSLEGLTAPAKLREQLPGAINFDLGVDVSHAMAKAQGHLHLADVRGAAALAGPVSVSFDLQGGLERAEGTVKVDLGGATLAVPDGMWEKQSGVPAGIELGWGAAGYGKDGAEVDVQASWTTRNLFYPKMTGTMGARALPSPDAALGGLKRLAISQQMGRSDLSLTVDVADAGQVATAVRSSLIDVPEVIGIIEPWLTRLNAALSAEAPEGEAAPEATPPPLPEIAQTASEDALPPVTVDLRIQRIQLGYLEQLDDVTLLADLRSGLPHSASFSMRVGEGRVAADLAPAASAQPWTLQVDDLSLLVGQMMGPLAVLPEAARPEGSTFGDLVALPDKLSGGSINADGTVNLRRAPDLTADFHMQDLSLRQEIGFLSRIAGLINRRVLLEIPFNRFDLDDIHYTPEHLSIASGYIDGPINIGIKRLDLDLGPGLLDMEGKVWGVCFQVFGPVADPSFYLCEKMPVIDTLTTEDEFEW